MPDIENKLSSILESKLVEEIMKSGKLVHFNEGDVIIDDQPPVLGLRPFRDLEDDGRVILADQLGCGSRRRLSLMRRAGC